MADVGIWVLLSGGGEEGEGVGSVVEIVDVERERRDAEWDRAGAWVIY